MACVPDPLDDLVLTAQREGVLLVLVRCRGNVAEAARALKRDRSGIYQIMRRTRVTRAVIENAVARATGGQMPTKCNQQSCEVPAAYRFTWPGRDEAGICAEHVGKLRSVADALGLPLQILALDSDVDALRPPERRQGHAR